MYCEKCGNNLIESVNYCTKCGSPQISETGSPKKEDDSTENNGKEFNFTKEIFIFFVIFSLLALVFYPGAEAAFSGRLYVSIFVGGIVALFTTLLRERYYNVRHKKITHQVPINRENKIASFFSKIPSLISFILIFAIINGFLWGAQELYHYNDNKKLDDMKMEINRLDSQKSTFEFDMKINGATKAEYERYSQQFDERNKLADEYNKLAKETGSRWYLIPIPFGRSRAIK